jgi:hypothetical protein
MKPVRSFTVALLPLLLCGCLEVEQHPKWVHGQYNGKPDNLPYQVNFHNDKMAWFAAIADRNHLQNEYIRTEANQ